MNIDNVSDFDIARGIEIIKSLAKQDLGDGLKLLRLIGPELNPEYNDQVGVAECRCPEQMVAETNRGGKSLVCAAKIAAACRDVPLLTWDEQEIDCRQPHQKGRPLTVWIVGLQLSHIGKTIFRLLFQEGAFKVIRDEDTRAWRSWRPWEQSDADRYLECRPSPPLIPPEAIDHDTWEWESKAGKEVAGVRLRNGTQIYFWASTADVKQGDPVDIIWLDENIKYSEHYTEWWTRLTDYSGWILWSTMLRRNVPAINRVLERDELQREELERGERAKVTTKVFRFRQVGNPFLPEERVELNREMYASEGDEAVAQRLEGGSPFDDVLIYPFFSKKIHAAIPDDQSEWDNLARVLNDLGGLPPADWCHELIIDPGARKPAVLFCAVPPKSWLEPKTGKEIDLWADHSHPFYVPYDEIYGKRLSVKELAPLIKEKMRGIRFRRFIIDMQAGQQTPIIGGSSVQAVFTQEFLEYGIEPEQTGIGSMFISGDKNFQSRSRIVDNWMQVRQCGKPLLRIVTKRCPNLVWQLARNQRKMAGDVVLDEPEKRERNDLRECLEYAASRGGRRSDGIRIPQYVEVSQFRSAPNWVSTQRRKIDELFGKNKEHETRCHFGPGLAPTGVA